MDELVRIMEANAHCEKRPNDACPAKWSKGDKALTPNEKMVGNVYEAING
jgi:peroxiredoxin (alkyl hydroperoxide reductase subunit C)